MELPSLQLVCKRSSILALVNANIILKGIGTWIPATEEAQSRAKSWILTALQAGYRHIDTAQAYGSEKAVGDAIRESGIPRDQIFVTTKLPWDHQERVAESFETSLKNLGLDYVDLYLLHWPQALFYQEGGTVPRNSDGTVRTTEAVNFNQSWAAIEKLLHTRKVKAIGVSNFSVKTLEQLFKTAKVTPAVNQVELHPYLSQEGLREYCAKKGIAVVAYTPSGYATVRGDPLIVKQAKKYNVTPNQVILAWHIAKGNVIVPKSENAERQKENITLPTLDAEDVAKISGLDRNERLCNKPDEKGQVWGWTMEQLGW